jgi:hypothetical protein
MAKIATNMANLSHLHVTGIIEIGPPQGRFTMT